MEEQWRTVVTDNGEVWDNYEVSNYGQVRNKTTGTVLKAWIYGRYLQIDLYKNKKKKKFLVHRLVAFAWIPNDDVENKTDVNHLDHNTLNNRVDNLEWTTHRGNIIHGRGKRVRCVETGQVWDSVSLASQETGICDVCIYHCCSGKHKTCGKQKLHFEYVE